MRTLLRWCRSAGRGVAAVEFALTFPILLLLLGGATDFGIVYYREGCLSSAVAAAAQYAILTDQAAAQSGGPALTASNVQTVMRNAAAQSMPGVTVSASVAGPACYCMSGSSPSTTMSTTAVTCGSTCSSGGTASKYVQLTLTHNYTAILPLLSMMHGTTALTKTAWVPLQ